GEWPWATFTVNVAGAFLLGYLITRLQERLPLSAYRRPFLGTGFCGALTTFSTMQVELLRMLDGDHVALAVGYAAASIAAGFVGAYTTFSTWALESHRLGEDGELRLGALNFAASLMLGLLAAWAGRHVGAAL